MAVPKKKQSHSRTRMRRSHDALTSPSLKACDNCGELIKPHRVCHFCGYYKGNKIVAVKEL